MIKHIIRQVNPEHSNFHEVFDDDGLTDLFIVDCDRRGYYHGFNIPAYMEVKAQADVIIDGFNDVVDGLRNYDGSKITYKDVMNEAGINYNSTLCHKLRNWAKNADSDDTSDIADFLTITTGKYWTVNGVHGYCQGAYCEVVFNAEMYSNSTYNSFFYGEMWLGIGNEYCVIDLDDDGNETDECYGYFVSDSQAFSDDRIKQLVCEWAGIAIDETQLEIIDGYNTVTTCNYRIA